MKRPLFILTLVVFAVVFAGCASDGGSGGTTEPPTTTVPSAPITVDQLVARSAATPITVSGLLITQDGVVKLCELILESYPPQCGGAFVELTGIDVAAQEGAQTVEGVTWIEGAVVTVQRQQDGTFAVVSG